jgi:rhodanese-related sulfurtransferase
MPLYRELSAFTRESPSSRRLVVVAEDADPGLEDWLSKEGIEPDKIVRVDNLVTAGVWGTPTLFLLEQASQITDLIVGLVSATMERDLWARLEGRGDARQAIRPFEAPTVQADLVPKESKERRRFIDFRPRPRFREKSFPGSVNIPLRELQERAGFELLNDGPIYLACFEGPLGLCQAVAGLLNRLGASRIVVAVPAALLVRANDRLSP